MPLLITLWLGIVLVVTLWLGLIILACIIHAPRSIPSHRVITCTQMYCKCLVKLYTKSQRNQSDCCIDLLCLVQLAQVQHLHHLLNQPVCVCMWDRECVCMRVCECVCMWDQECMRECMCVYARVCECMRECVCMRVWVYASVCVCVCTCMQSEICHCMSV